MIRLCTVLVSCTLAWSSAAQAEETLEERVARLEDAQSAPRLLDRLTKNEIMLSGSGAFAFFAGESSTPFSEETFRIDEARLFMDARLYTDAYFFSEIVINERESPDDKLRVGEIYVEWENPLQHILGRKRLNLRMGRFDIPFGEEYMTRDPVENPLVSHSLADFWGVDEGIECYGQVEGLEYVIAVQNGGHPSLKDGDGDKAVVARVGLPISRGLRASVSAMRTGDLHPERDGTSEIWFANNFIVPLGEADEVQNFRAEFVQADVQRQWTGGQLALAFGLGEQETDLVNSADTREAQFASITLVQDISDTWFTAARYSRIDSDEGWPVVGQGRFPDLFRGQQAAEEVWRGSLGLGYRLRPEVIIKAEYSIEEGQNLDGSNIDRRNILSLQTAFAL